MNGISYISLELKAEQVSGLDFRILTLMFQQRVVQFSTLQLYFHCVRNLRSRNSQLPCPAYEKHARNSNFRQFLWFWTIALIFRKVGGLNEMERKETGVEVSENASERLMKSE